jgi:hypothetical protein
MELERNYQHLPLINSKTDLLSPYVSVPHVHALMAIVFFFSSMHVHVRLREHSNDHIFSLACTRQVNAFEA